MRKVEKIRNFVHDFKNAHEIMQIVDHSKETVNISSNIHHVHKVAKIILHTIENAIPASTT